MGNMDYTNGDFLKFVAQDESFQHCGVCIVFDSNCAEKFLCVEILIVAMIFSHRMLVDINQTTVLPKVFMS